MRFEYPALFEDHDGEIVVSFPDIPEALTSGETWDDAYEQAMDALGAALAGYVKQGKKLPAVADARGQMVLVSPSPLVAAKLALRARMAELVLNNVALAERLGVSETVVRRMLDLDHESRLSNVVHALTILGQRVVVEVTARADAA